MDLDSLDLSFLSGKEREEIAAVLDRDRVVREKDERRIQRLKNMHGEGTTRSARLFLFTGEWFISTKGRMESKYWHASKFIRELLNSKIRSTSTNQKQERSAVQEKPPPEVDSLPRSLHDILLTLSNSSRTPGHGKAETTKIFHREKIIIGALTRKDDATPPNPQVMKNSDPFYSIKGKVSIDHSALQDLIRNETKNTTGISQPAKKRRTDDQRFYTSFR